MKSTNYFITILYCIGLSLLTKYCFGQSSVGFDINANISKTDAFYGNLKTWIPDNQSPLGNAPTKQLKIALHIFQSGDLTKPNHYTKKDINLFHDVIYRVNAHYNGQLFPKEWQFVSKPSDPILPPEKEVPNTDTKVKFSIGEKGQERIFFYQKESLHANTSPTKFYNYIKEQHATTDFEVDEFINVYFTTGRRGSIGGFASSPSFRSPDKKSYVVMLKGRQPDGDAFAIASLLAHELGHCVDLRHTYAGGGAGAICNQNHVDYLTDIFGGGSPCPHPANRWDSADPFKTLQDGYTNNLMGGYKGNEYISPMQAGKMHRCLALSSVRKYVDNCAYSSVPLPIKKDEVWDFDIQLYRDLIVQRGNTLTINGTLRLSGPAKIIVEKGATLIVTGRITSACPTQNWEGIQVDGNKKVLKKAILTTTDRTLKTAQGGVVIVTDKATIEKMNISLFSNRPGARRR